MKDFIFAMFIVGFALYTLVSAFTGFGNPEYGIYGILAIMGTELALDYITKRKVNGDKA